MYWQEKSEEKSFEASDEVLDLCFKMECKSLPLDHAHALSQALTQAAPWLSKTKHSAIHLIHGAESGNGWMRPDNPENEVLHLSRRARFTLRIHQDNRKLAEQLSGLRLSIDGHQLLIKEYKPQLLLPLTTIFSRYIVTPAELDEDAFLDLVAPSIEAQGIQIKKMMGGKQHQFRLQNQLITTRSLMLSDLEKEESITLQQNGLGEYQLFGMGIFLPHKGISAVTQLNDEIPSMET